MPQAMRALCPIATTGTPGMVTPATSRSAATKCISYHTDGNSICKCGSLASIGRPPLVLRAASTQLLLLPRRPVADSHSRPFGYLMVGRCALANRGNSTGAFAAGTAVVVAGGATRGAP